MRSSKQAALSAGFKNRSGQPRQLRGGEIADDVRIYGVSAQGGTYPSKKRENKDDEDRKRLTSIRPASKRIRVVGHGANEHDLTHPVRWLSGLEDGN